MTPSRLPGTRYFFKLTAKLQKMVIAEELDYDNVVKLAFEQGEKKVEQIRTSLYICWGARYAPSDIKGHRENTYG